MSISIANFWQFKSYLANRNFFRWEILTAAGHCWGNLWSLVNMLIKIGDYSLIMSREERKIANVQFSQF
jgi:hypothetical protein